MSLKLWHSVWDSENSILFCTVLLILGVSGSKNNEEQNEQLSKNLQVAIKIELKLVADFPSVTHFVPFQDNRLTLLSLQGENKRTSNKTFTGEFSLNSMTTDEFSLFTGNRKAEKKIHFTFFHQKSAHVSLHLVRVQSVPKFIVITSRFNLCLRAHFYQSDQFLTFVTAFL